jgi:hypothetical protein
MEESDKYWIYFGIFFIGLLQFVLMRIAEKLARLTAKLLE